MNDTIQQRDPLTRLAGADDWNEVRPVYVVWELTLACDQRCGHCGSRAGRVRDGELALHECLDVVAQLAAMGTREVTLIGGEAYLHPDWLAVIRAITDAGMLCTLQSGGRLLSAERLDAAIDAGLASLGISIDGPNAVHDELRRVPGSAAAAWHALRLAQARGLPTTVNTTITPACLRGLQSMFDDIVEAGVKTWQVGINVAMGRAANDPSRLLQPHELLTLMPLLAELARRGREHDLLLMPGNTVGYFGPHEALLRHGGAEHMHWVGCNAGRNSMGLESDGTLKACPSLPREGYAAGNVRTQSIADMWRNADAARYLRTRTKDDLWGFCRTCVYAADCLAGCAWVSHSFMGRPGNNPYCHHRALELDKRGLRERIVPIAPPPGEPFDLGRFALYLESKDGSSPPRLQQPPPFSPPQTVERSERPLPRRLFRCSACSHYSLAAEGSCDHCGFDLAGEEKRRGDQVRQARKALVRLRVLMDRHLAPKTQPALPSASSKL